MFKQVDYRGMLYFSSISVGKPNSCSSLAFQFLSYYYYNLNYKLLEIVILKVNILL